MSDALIGPLAGAGVLIPFLCWLTWRTERRLRTTLDAHLAAAERERTELQAATDRLLAEEEAQAAARLAAWEPEQAALDATEPSPAHR